MTNKKITTKELVQLAIFAAIMVITKEALSFIPNVNPIMLLITIATLTYRWKAMLCVICFDIIEMALYGLGIWSVMYIYIWPLAVVLVIAFSKKTSPLFWAVFCGCYGLIFGALCALPYIFISGIKAAFSYWLAGISYDLIHGVSNFIITLLLFKPLLKLLTKLKAE